MLILLAGRVNAAATMESIGAEKCGGRVNAFEVEFLAPDNAALEAVTRGRQTYLLAGVTYCRQASARYDWLRTGQSRWLRLCSTRLRRFCL
jgi:hypothetical protein